MGLIVSAAMLDAELPDSASDSSGQETAAVTEATAFVNTWAKSYLEFDAYSGTTINAPREIARICLQVAKVLYLMNIGQVYRDGEESVDHETRLEYYRQLLMNIQIEPVLYTKIISLDSNGAMLIAQRQNILTHNAYVTSGSDEWNLGQHFIVRKGGAYDDEYWDGWYFDASSYKSTMDGTLNYWRSFRNDAKDYMKTYRNKW